MQAPAATTIMAHGPIKPMEFILPQKGLLSNPPLQATENPGSANPGELPYEIYGLGGLQNTLSEL